MILTTLLTIYLGSVFCAQIIEYRFNYLCKWKYYPIINTIVTTLITLVALHGWVKHMVNKN